MREKIVSRIAALEREIAACLDVPQYDGPASASIQLVWEQAEANARLPRLRNELNEWRAALAEFDRLPEATRADLHDDIAQYRPPLELSQVIEAVDRLTPELISHLRSHHDDVDHLPWDVFEHLVG